MDADKAEGLDAAAFEALGREIAGLYSRTGFGRVLKSEIDLVYFRHFLRASLKPRFLEGGRIRFIHIDKAEIYRLSLRAGMSEARFKKLLEDCFLAERSELKPGRFFLELVNHNRLGKAELTSGRISLLVPNPIARAFLEDAAWRFGAEVEYGHNREIVHIGLADFLRIVEVAEVPDIAALVRANLLSKSRDTGEMPEVRAFFDELAAVPPAERAERIARALAGKLAGRLGDEVVDALVGALTALTER